jgi:hypothetical protein
MKAFFIILGIVILIIIGFLLLVRLGIHTDMYTIAEYSEGSDRLTLEYRHTTDWGNSRTAIVLLFNGKIVDYKGTLGRENEVSKVFPVRSTDVRQLQPEIVDEQNALPLGALECLQRSMMYVPESEQYRAIQAQHPNVATWIPWTLWVSPKEFSQEVYMRINELLRHGGRDLIAQQRSAKPIISDQLPHLYRWQAGKPVAIWRTVYFDYTQLNNEVYERTTPAKEERIEIAPSGYACFRHKSTKYTAGYGCAFGLLNDTADTLTVGRAWKYTDEAFPLSELSNFRDAQGRALSDVYRVVEEPDTAKIHE